MSISNICHISTFSPTQCGIATYTEDLIQNLEGINHLKIRVIYDNEVPSSKYENVISIKNLETYDKAIKIINNSNSDVVSLQHEFGIYGGNNGEYVLHLVDGIKKPIVTTMHSIYNDMWPEKKKILEKLMERSVIVVTLSEESKGAVTSQFGLPDKKIKIIRHGIPNVKFTYPETTRLRKVINKQLVFISAGHVRPTKGYEVALQALAKYRVHNENFQYIILGKAATHVNKWGNTYNMQIKKLINELNLTQNVTWIEEYLDVKGFLDYIMAADIGLVTYTGLYQSSSGILPIILGCGRIAIATSFDYIKSIPRHIKGLYLATINDPNSVYEKICEAIENRNEMHLLMKSNYLATREWTWANSATQYLQVFSEACEISRV